MIGVIFAVLGVTVSQRNLNSAPSLGAWQSLPYLLSGVQTHQFTSYDRAGDNYDADYFPLYKESNGETVIFDSYGPGCLYRLHANLWNGDLSGVNIRFYFDDDAKARIDMDVTKFYSTENPLGIFKEPYGHIGYGWRFLYHPFYYKRHLKVALSKEPFGQSDLFDKLPWLGKYDQHPYRRNHWYNFTYHTYSEGIGMPTWTQPVDVSSADSLWNDSLMGQPLDSSSKVSIDKTVTVPPGKQSEVVTLSGHGSIGSIELDSTGIDAKQLFNTWLQIRFDGAKQAQVSAPLGCFFGVYRTHPDKRIASRLIGSIRSRMYCYLPMPFATSASIVLVNHGDTQVSIPNLRATRSGGYPMDRCGYMYAVYHQEDPRQEGHDYRYIDKAGHGQVIGHFTYRTNTSMEEDERTYFDGSGTPWIIGEGFEDDHNQGWGLRDAQKALWGSTASDGGAGAPWRFFVPDLYVFNSAIRHGHQVYGPHSPLGHEGMYQVGSEESVAFLYAKEGEGMRLTDDFDPGSQLSEKNHSYKVFGSREDRKGSWWYDGEFNNVLFKTPAITDDGVSTDKGSQFTLKIDRGNHGVKLRRRTDKANNRQLATVYVDGIKVTERPWYSVDFEHTFRDIRWFDSDFEIPARYMKGKSKIKVRIEPISSKTGRWDEFHYWVFSYR